MMAAIARVALMQKSEPVEYVPREVKARGGGLVDRDLARPAGQVAWHGPLCMVRAKVDA